MSPNVLVVDLDDTLLKTDCLYEHLVLMLKTAPLKFFLMPFWLLKGRAFLKVRVAQSVNKAENLPVRGEVISVIREYKKRGCKTVLASASPRDWVQYWFNKVDAFDGFIASDENDNLKGRAKLERIKASFANAPFAYAGDSLSDLPIWSEAAEIIVVNPNSRLRQRLNMFEKPMRIIEDRKARMPLILKQLRPTQWVKNILVVLPVAAGHLLFTADNLWKVAPAFLGFSAAASFIYILNDLVDLSADRNHHQKKLRPFASCDLPIKYGILLMPLLLALSFFFASMLNTAYAAWILVYIVANLLYSFAFKKSLGLDIVLLSLMYTLRVYAGGAAFGVVLSQWLLTFCTLFFFSLACVKRSTELLRSQHKLTIDGRGYRPSDLQMVQTLGAGASLLSVLVILLYLQSSTVISLYSKPQYLWLLIPLLLYWTTRLWLLAHRDQIDDDPVIFAIKDRVSWTVGLLAATAVGISI